MEVIVDRIEDNFITLELENQSHVNVPRTLIPTAKEGDIIDININYEKRIKKEAEIKKMENNLFISFDEGDEEFEE